MNRDSSNQNIPQIFDAKRQRAKMPRAYHRLSRENRTSFIWNHIAEEFYERLSAVTREFKTILIIGPMTQYLSSLIDAGEKAIMRDASITLASPFELQDHIIIEEDNLPFEFETFDLIISAGSLDSVNDLPGALLQMRKALKPDGLLLGTIFGSGSLSTLKSIMMSADGDYVKAHIHPQIDIRTMADLLVRAGFQLPVADRDSMTIRYSSLSTLINDIRDIGAGNSLSKANMTMDRRSLVKAGEAWHALQEEDGKVSEQSELIHFSGWSPSPDQPKPARRGSGTMSLQDVLKAPSSKK